MSGPRVLVAGPGAGALAAVRGLHAAGYEPSVAVADSRSPAARSRLAACVFLVSEPGDDPLLFAETVADAALGLGAAVVLPAGADAQLALAGREGLLPRGTVLAEPGWGGVLEQAASREEDRRRRSGPTLLARLQPFAVRTGSGRLEPGWRALHEALMQALAAHVRSGDRGAAVYVKGGFARGDALVGISDIDLVVVGGPGSHERVRERWRRLCRRFPPLAELVQHFWVYEEDELRAVDGRSALTFGLDGRPGGDRAAFLGTRPVADELGLLARPSIADGSPGWRLLAGPDRRPSPRPPGPEDELIAGWLELQYWWRLSCEACSVPARPSDAALCVKLVAEPLRVVLAVEHGERPGGRRDVLLRGLELVSGESEAIREALALLDRLPQRPEPPLARVLPVFLRLAQRVAARADGLPTTEVRLDGDPAELIVGAGFERDGLLPLADWRACTRPFPDDRSLPDETFSFVDADVGDPAEVAALARASGRGPHAAVRRDGLLVMPTAERWINRRAVFRGIQCAASDPVSFALAAGERVARFPEMSGWSAAATARRAVAEHRAWLAPGGRAPPALGWISPQPDPDSDTTEALAMLLTAVRAARFLESVERGRPVLAVTLAALGRDDPTVAEAVEAYRARRAGSDVPLGHVVGALRAAVRSWPVYGGDR